MSDRNPIQCTIGGYVEGEYELAFAMGDHAVTFLGINEDDLREISSCIHCVLDDDGNE